MFAFRTVLLYTQAGNDFAQYYYNYANCLNDYDLINPRYRDDFILQVGSLICSLKKNRDCTRQSHGGYLPNIHSGDTCAGK